MRWFPPADHWSKMPQRGQAGRIFAFDSSQNAGRRGPYIETKTSAVMRRCGEGASVPMAEITHFMVVPFDYVGDEIVAGEAVTCESPAAAIARAQGLWKTFGHAGAIAISRTSDFELGKFEASHVLRRFGQVPSEY